jgi:phosphatidylglycerol:prolipoprotein diacylglycerol transferase
MFPTIFSVGPFTLFTFNIFLILGVVGGAFLFWQRSHAEHFEDDEVFDVMLISSIMALILSRVMYVALHLTTIFMDMKGWLEAIGKPGFDELTALVVGLWYVWFLSRRKKWDAFELADFGAISVCFAFIFIWIGRFFAGTFVGDVTGLPMGVNFPNVFDKRHPTQLYFALCFLLLYIVLLFLEKRYRFFSMVSSGKTYGKLGVCVVCLPLFLWTDSSTIVVC